MGQPSRVGWPAQRRIVVKGFIVGTVITAIAFYVLTEFLPQVGVTYDGELIGLLVLAVIFGVINGLIGPLVKTAAIPINFMTMGLVGFLINAGLLLVTALIADSAGFNLTVGDFPPDLTADTLVAAILGSVVLSIVSTVVRQVIPD
jgi:putative membrane protein